MLFVLHTAERVVRRKVGTFFRIFFYVIYLYYPPNHLTHSHAVGVEKVWVWVSCVLHMCHYMSAVLNFWTAWAVANVDGKLYYTCAITVVQCLAGCVVHMHHCNSTLFGRQCCVHVPLQWGSWMCTCAMYYKSTLHGELHCTYSFTLVQFMAGWTAHELLVVQCMGRCTAPMCHYKSAVLSKLDCIHVPLRQHSALLAALCMFQYTILQCMSLNSYMVPEFLPFKKLHCYHVGNGESR